MLASVDEIALAVLDVLAVRYPTLPATAVELVLGRACSLHRMRAEPAEEVGMSEPRRVTSVRGPRPRQFPA